jgi:hypothetical protein
MSKGPKGVGKSALRFKSALHLVSTVCSELHGGVAWQQGGYTCRSTVCALHLLLELLSTGGKAEGSCWFADRSSCYMWQAGSVFCGGFSHASHGVLLLGRRCGWRSVTC